MRENERKVNRLLVLTVRIIQFDRFIKYIFDRILHMTMKIFDIFRGITKGFVSKLLP